MNNEIKQSILEIIKSCDSLQLCTFALETYPETRHIMNAMNSNATDLNLHFMTNKMSPKFAQLQKNSNCCLYYFNPANRHAVRLFGKIEIIDDQNEKTKYWRDDYKVYGYSGAEDKNYALLHFVPKEYKFYAGMELKTGKI
ncbi:MAG TPA: pyridoxamine 5'-phosphate oxidase family protein [Alphaproteobacteria bacterium]|mgnify:CR=1 FL=1|nr:pyridoxamine 5'-phosphate oxidase family protein [Alphaproteobacteria bacterium]